MATTIRGPRRSDPAGTYGSDLSVEDARQATKTGHMRWVLGISVVLAALALGVIWLAFLRPTARPPVAPSASALNPPEQHYVTPSSPSSPPPPGPQTSHPPG